MDWLEATSPRKKKTDHTALRSPFARIPGVDVATARALLDLGYREVDDLRGRSAESLMEEHRAQTATEAPTDRLARFKVAIYFAETPDPDPDLLQPWKWT